MDGPISVEKIGKNVNTVLVVNVDNEAVDNDKVDAIIFATAKVLPDKLE